MANPLLRIFHGLVKADGFIHDSVVSITASATASRIANAGRTNKLAAAAGLTVTLPASSGSGNRYRFLVGTTVTSNSYIVKVANTTDVFVGGIVQNDIGDSSAATADFYPTASTSDTITLAASVGAGKAGDWVEVEDYAAGFWAVRGAVQGITDPTSPFSATVS